MMLKFFQLQKINTWELILKNKKILIVADSFEPDKTAAAQILNDLKNFYKNSNNKVLIVVPRDKIGIVSRNNTEVLNIFCGPIKSKYLILRGFFEYIMQFILYLRTASKIIKFHPDYLICYSPSIFFHYLIKKIIHKNKIKSYLILRDIFPFWAIECGYINNFFLKRFYISSFKNFVKIFDTIGVESFSNINYLKKKIRLKKVNHLPNWIKLKKVERKKKKIPNSFIFSGNLGGGQDIKKVHNFFVKIRKLQKIHNLCILGEGTNSISINKFQNLNINYYKKLTFKKYVKFLDQYEYGIISLRDEIQSVNFPGRLLTYLNSGLPIVILSNKINELSKFVIDNKIGVVINPKENIEYKLRQLKKIRKNFTKFKTDRKILKKYFNLKNNAKKIFSKS